MAEGHRCYLLLDLHQQRIVLDLKIILHELLEDLVHSHMVDTRVGFEPLDLNIEIFKDARPISHMFKLVARTSLLLAEDLF